MYMYNIMYYYRSLTMTPCIQLIWLQVAHLNFSPYYNISTEATNVTHYFNKIVSIECAEDVLSSSSDIRTQVCMNSQ
jgi:hypothetical protein